MKFSENVQGGSFWGDQYCVVKVKGKDCIRFMNGQLTSDVLGLKVGSGHLSTRLDRAGKVVSFFYFLRSLDDCYLVIPKDLVQRTIDDLDKYIIMDDVSLEITNLKPYFSYGLSSEDHSFENSFEVNLYEMPGKVSLFVDKDLSLENDSTRLEEDRLLSGFPKIGKNIFEGDSVNSSRLVELSVSLSKGCFLGQETVSKIQSNRGAAYFSSLLISKGDFQKSSYPLTFSVEGRKGGKIFSCLKVNDFFVYEVELFRDFRVEGRELEVCIDEDTYKCRVKSLPVSKLSDKKDFARACYDKAVEEFHLGNEDLSLDILKKVIILDPSFSDAFEVIGVILGRHGKFQEGIDYMDKLLEVDETSVMAHTNKSLYLMKLGKIEEAEKEKSKATIKTFEMYGREAKAKKELEAQKEKEKQEILRRESMFKEVLEIDPDDTLANFGMADISFSRECYDDAIIFLDKVLSEDSNYSNAYLLLGKSYMAKNENERAVDILEKGVVISSKNGDMMPANAMQAKLTELKRLT